MNWLDPNLQWVLLGTTLLGIAAGALGGFAFLRGRSLMGDALAHAALPGVCGAFIFAELLRARGSPLDSKSLPLLLGGASITGFLAAGCVAVITRYSRLKEDAAQAIVLTVFFGAGVVLLTYIKNSGASAQSGLEKFLFGQTAALVGSDVKLMAAIALLLCCFCALFFKELKLLCFDAEFGSGLGFSMPRLDALLLLMIVASVVIGLQAVGVVLISALLITPAAAARFWTDKLGAMIVLAAVLGGCSGLLGTVLSALPAAQGLPTGPMIVLAATAVFAVSVVLAPRRGALARLLKTVRTRQKVARENALRDLYELTEEASGARAVEESTFLARRSGTSRHVLQELEKSRLIEPAGTGAWKLTSRGLQEAYRVVRNHRLWEMFLMYETTLGAVAVDRDADAVEHFLPPESVAQLETMLRKNGLEPPLPQHLSAA